MTGFGSTVVLSWATLWRSVDGPEDDPHPRYEDFPDNTAYEQAFHMWRARQRDNPLNPEEMAAQFAVIEHAILNRPDR